jgi:hypothetical protein
MKLTPWLVEEGYCAMRCIEGSDPKNIATRVAFIEKTPRVRIAPYTTEEDEQGKWLQGPKGSGGENGHIPENKLYGFFPKSRAWCDKKLVKMGYVLG